MNDIRLAVPHDAELYTLIAYSYFGFQNTDLEHLLKNISHNSADLINLRKCKDLADQEVYACFLGALNVHSSVYLMYAYIHDNKEYGFAWDTDNEEMFSHSIHPVEPPWFEFIKQGHLFRIKINKTNPYLHYITEKPFAFINGPVLKLGSCREVYPVQINTENQYASR
jgi:hypothetical protein